MPSACPAHHTLSYGITCCFDLRISILLRNETRSNQVGLTNSEDNFLDFWKTTVPSTAMQSVQEALEPFDAESCSTHFTGEQLKFSADLQEEDESENTYVTVNSYVVYQLIDKS